MTTSSSPRQRPYQQQGSAFLLDAGRAILADEAGVGKTNQLLLAARGRTLILSPAGLADVWREAIEMWGDQLDPSVELSWMSYSGICKRVPKEPGKPAALVVPAPRSGLDLKWDTIIADEGHYLKNPRTNWTKVVRKMKSERFYLGTGTPLPNWAHEIFTILRFLYPGDKRFTNYQRWLTEYFKTWKPPYGGKYNLEIEGLHRGLTWEIAAQEWGLPGRWLRRLLDEVLPELPPMTRQTVKVRMTGKQATAYRQLDKEWRTILPETGHEIVSWDDGGIYSKMLQCSTGLFSLHPEESGGSAKLTALRDLMAERHHPTIVFCAFINTADGVGEQLTKDGRQVTVVSSKYSRRHRLDAVAAFRRGEINTLVGTVGTLSEGITLTRADTCIFIERSPRPVTNAQARNRIRRFGQDRPTLCIDLVTEETLDEDLLGILERKEVQTDLALTGIQLAALRGC